jgi:hypothetical protein
MDMAMKIIIDNPMEHMKSVKQNSSSVTRETKKSNKIQSPIKATYNNSNDRTLEVSVRPLNSICLTKTKVHCSVGSRHHKPLTGRDVVDVRTSAVSEVYLFILLQTELFFIAIVKTKSVSIPFFSLPCWRKNSERDSDRIKKFSSFHSIHTGSGARLPPFELETGALSSGVKPMEHEANYLKQALGSIWCGDIPPLSQMSLYNGA